MLILLLFTFIAGALTILAPCVWPLLPALLSSESNLHGRRRPLGLVTGVVVSFGILTLSAAYLEKSLGIKEQYIRDLSVIILIVMGLLLMIPPLVSKFESKVSYLVGRFAPKPKANSTGFGGGFLVGISLGILWTPCTGPIFAAITTQAAASKFNGEIFLVTLFYLFGVSIPLYFLVVGGKKVIQKTKALNRHLGRVQIISGIILISFAILTATGYDKTAEVYLLNKLPSYTNFLTGIEKTPTVKKELAKITNHKIASVDDSNLFNIPAGSKAPEIVGDTSWINSKPLTIASLKGHVVLVDFWTYTCINCIRSLHYVTKWYNTYKNQGFIVIGVHSPEFPFEQERSNVIAATHRFGITYPVVQDNQLATWNNYNNEYWPAEYLIDANGYLRRADFGEGNYNQMEAAIQALLKDSGKTVTNPISDPLNVDLNSQTSLETYLGTFRESQSQNPYQALTNGINNYHAPTIQGANTFSIGGTWNVSNMYISSTIGSTINYNFIAHQVYIILRPSKLGAVDQVKVFYNGQLLESSFAGSDLKHGIINVDSDRLYNIFNSGNNISNGVLKLVFQNKNTQAYTFTFG